MTEPAAPPPSSPSTPTAPPSSDAPLGALVHQLSEQVPDLIRSEMRLAQAELAEKGKSAGKGLGAFGAAGLLALYGVACLLAAGVLALALALPAWAAALIVGLLLLTAAALAGLTGKKSVEQATPPAPERAIAGIKDDVATIKGGHQ